MLRVGNRHTCWSTQIKEVWIAQSMSIKKLDGGRTCTWNAYVCLWKIYHQIFETCKKFFIQRFVISSPFERQQTQQKNSKKVSNSWENCPFGAAELIFGNITKSNDLFSMHAHFCNWCSCIKIEVKDRLSKRIEPSMGEWTSKKFNDFPSNYIYFFVIELRHKNVISIFPEQLELKFQKKTTFFFMILWILSRLIKCVFVVKIQQTNKYGIRLKRFSSRTSH